MTITTIKDLALKYGMEPKKVRRILRKGGIKKGKKYYWKWKTNSKTLNKVEGLLSRI